LSHLDPHTTRNTQGGIRIRTSDPKIRRLVLMHTHCTVHAFSGFKQIIYQRGFFEIALSTRDRKRYRF
jgi:hypothetical protein